MTMNLTAADQLVTTKPTLRARADKPFPSNTKPSKGEKAAADPAATPAKQVAGTKAAVILKKLATAKGATLEQLMEATAWQAHSLRGFLSGTVKKKLGLTLVSEVGKDGVRRYRTDGPAKV
jgi:hypothetical protein